MVQLRREDRAGQMWNLVGFQTRLRIPEQQRVFRMIPGLEQRGVPALRQHPPELVPQQPGEPAARRSPRATTTGCSSPASSPASRATPSRSAPGSSRASTSRACSAGSRPPSRRRPRCSAALYRYLREADPRHFQPMNANFGLLEPLPGQGRRRIAKKELLVERAQADFGLASEVGEGGSRCIRAKRRTHADMALRALVTSRRPDDASAATEVAEFLTHLEKETRPVAPHGEGLRPRPRGVHRVLRPALRRRAGAGRRWTGSACAASSASCSGAGSRSARPRARSRRCGASTATCRCTTASPNAVARAARVPKLDKRLPTYLDREQTERAVRVGGGARRGRRVRRRPATSRCWSCSTPPASGCPS